MLSNLRFVYGADSSLMLLPHSKTSAGQTMLLPPARYFLLAAAQQRSWKAKHRSPKAWPRKLPQQQGL